MLGNTKGCKDKNTYSMDIPYANHVITSYV